MSAMPEHFRTEARIDQLRVPPHRVDAEQAVLGGVMLQPAALWKVRDLLSESDFYRRDHRLIYRAILDLGAPPAGKSARPIDAVTMGDWFEANDLAEQIGGSGYLIELSSNTPSAANIVEYAKIVREMAVLRELIEAGTEIVNDGFQPGGRSALEILGLAQGRLGHVLRTEPSELSEPGPILAQIMEDAQAFLDAGGGHFEGLTTSIPELDDLLCGLKPGQLIIVAGRPKQGKTTLARVIAEHVALQQRKRVAFHSLEMPEKQLLIAACCSIGRVHHEDVRRWQLDDEQWSAFSEASGKLRTAPLLLSKPRNTRIEQLVAQTRRAHAEKPLGLVVIDYLQLIHAPGDNRSQAIGDITRALKLMAEELQIPVILLSQLNRKLEERTDKRPMPSDLRDSGAIEQDADVVIFVYRDETYHKDSRHRGTAEVIVGLQRAGRTGTVRVLSRLDICRFEPLPLDWEPLPLPPPVAGDAAERKGGSPFATKGSKAARDRAADSRIRDVTGGN